MIPGSLSPLTALEIAANTFNVISIVLAGRNHVQTWWTGIVGCALFGVLFALTQLYADSTLQLFFIATSVIGWRRWVKGGGAAGRNSMELPIRSTPARGLGLACAAALLVTLAYGLLLRAFTDAYAPFADSFVLAGSVVAQLLLMERRYETWVFWWIVDTVAVPLYYARGLEVTAVLYAAFWANALVSWVHWRRILRESGSDKDSVPGESGTPGPR